MDPVVELFNRAFSLNEDEKHKLFAWVQEHNKSCPLVATPGPLDGRFIVSFQPCSIGTFAKVKCGCGEETELTDVTNW